MKAKSGDTVRVRYSGRLTDGTVFDASEEDAPLTFTIGEQQIIPGFEQAVIGMEPGESVTTTIPASQAYGPHHPEMVATVERSSLPDGLDPKVGQALRSRDREGHTMDLVVVEVSPQDIRVDANHPLAGKDLTFDITLVDLV